MMLRASVEATEGEVDLRAITDPTVDSRIPAGRALVDLVDTVVRGGNSRPARLRVLTELGTDGLVAVAGVLGTFEMMNRIADATGMPVGQGTLKRTTEVRALLGLDRFQH